MQEQNQGGVQPCIDNDRAHSTEYLHHNQLSKVKYVFHNSVAIIVNYKAN